VYREESGSVWRLPVFSVWVCMETREWECMACGSVWGVFSVWECMGSGSVCMVCGSVWGVGVGGFGKWERLGEWELMGAIVFGCGSLWGWGVGVCMGC